MKTINSQVDNYNCSRGSERKIEVFCELSCSEKCRGTWTIQYRRALDSIKNNGKIICLYCSRASKFSGRNNPNCKYKNLDDNLFESIDSEDKAYLLGFIAGDGCIQSTYRIQTVVHRRDKQHLTKLKDMVCSDIPVFTKDKDFVGFNIHSRKMTHDICKWLRIKPQKKSHKVGFPDIFAEDLRWHFIRGLFDADGHTVQKFDYLNSPHCTIGSCSAEMKHGIEKTCNIPCRTDCGRITWSGENCVKFLQRMYLNSSIYMQRKKDNMLQWKEYYEV